MPASEYDLRKELVRFGRLCYDRHLLVSMDGNLSARLPSGDVLCTPSGVHKGFLSEDDLIVVDREGRVRRGEGKPTSEVFMHLACYAERPDVGAVIHAHPPLSIAFTIAGVSMARCVLPEVVLTLGVVPTVPYETTGTRALADAIRAHIRSYDAVLMDTHGALAVGRSPLEAFCRLETIEHTALIMKSAQELGGIRNLPAEEALRLRRLGLERYGGPPEAVSKASAPMADLPPACLHCTSCACPHPAGLGAPADVRVARLTNVPQRPTLGELRSGQIHEAPLPIAASGVPTVRDYVVDEVVKALRSR